MVGEIGTTDVLAQGGSDQNFLLPNGTLFFEILLFAVVFFLISRFIVPPIRKALADREERVRQTQRDRESADEKFAEAKRQHDEILAEARNSASQIREEARASAREDAAQLREQAEQEVRSERERGDRELADQRSRVQENLRSELPDLSRTLAERILGRSLSDEDRRRSTVDDYLSSVGGGNGTSSEADTRVASGSEDR